MILKYNDFNKASGLTVLSVVEDRDYFLWQQEVQSYHMKENFKHINFEVIVIHEGENPSDWAKHIGTISNTSYYRVSNESYKSYKASYKPLGLHYRINDGSKSTLENILAIDSDVILNRDLKYSELVEGNAWMMSNCDGYLGYNYLKKNLSESRISELADIVRITLEDIKSIKVAGGAQYLYKGVSNHKSIFEKMANDSVELYKKLKDIAEKDNSKIQIWTAEMWSQLWNGAAIAEINVPESMNFCMAPDPLDKMKKTAFTHFAGSPGEGSFQKTKTQNAFLEDFSNVTNNTNCAWHWKTLVEKYKNKSFSIKNKSVLENYQDENEFIFY